MKREEIRDLIKTEYIKIVTNDIQDIQKEVKKLIKEEDAVETSIKECNAMLFRLDSSFYGELCEDLSLINEKYKVRLNNVRKEMVKLSRKIREITDVLDNLDLDTKIIINAFYLQEYDADEDIFTNLMRSKGTGIGYVIRQSLIQSKKMTMEIMGCD